MMILSKSASIVFIPAAVVDSAEKITGIQHAITDLPV